MLISLAVVNQWCFDGPTTQRTFEMQSRYTPLDLEVRDFGDYQLIIDARSPREFAEDHLPTAVNYPVVDNDEYAQVGTLHRSDTHAAYLIGVTHSLRNMANWIEQIGQQCSPASRILVYCFRGGKRSKLWSDTLRTIGFKVDVLPGGWKSYRRWVMSGLEVVPRELIFKVLTGPSGCGKTRLLQAIEQQGGQVLDLEALATHRGSLIGAVPECPQPTQKAFDSALLAKLRSFDVARPVFVESESKKIGSLRLPQSLMDSMGSADIVEISAPMPVRLKVWEADFGHFIQDPAALMDRIQHLLPLVGLERIKTWQSLAAAGDVLRIFEQLMALHYDPAYLRSSKRLFHGRRVSQPQTIAKFDDQAFYDAAAELIARHGAPIDVE